MKLELYRVQRLVEGDGEENNVVVIDKKSSAAESGD